MKSALVRFVALGGASLWPAAALATDNFPEAIVREVGGPPAACVVCHASPGGGVGSVTRSFGRAMQAAGLVKSDEATLAAALDTLERDATDSDGDGAPDIAELRAGFNPSSATSTPAAAAPDGGIAQPATETETETETAVPESEGGCNAAGTGGAGVSWAILALGFVVARRVRQRDQRGEPLG